MACKRAGIMIRLAVFDLDGTLAELGKAVKGSDLAKLKEIEDRGVTIALCSGKPAYYLCGFLRQTGLKDPAIVGENGSVIQKGIELPPERFIVQSYSKEAERTIEFLRYKLKEILPDMWYQPNLVGLTPFPKNEEQFEMIRKMLEENKDQIIDIDIYRHVDSYDFVPRGMSKYSGMKILGEMLEIPAEETVCVGDGVNDYPMFEYAGTSLGVSLQYPEKADYNFPCIGDALDHILREIKNQ